MQKRLLSATVLTILLLSTGTSLSALGSKPSTPGRLSAQAFSAGVILSQAGGIVAVEGIHVKQSVVGAFNLVVVYGGSLQNPVPIRVFVNNEGAAALLSLVFNGIVVTLASNSINVSKVGLAAMFEMNAGDTSLSFSVEAFTPAVPSRITYEFPNVSTGWVFNVAGIQFQALASGCFGLSRIPLSTVSIPPLGLPGFLVPEARIELAAI